MHPEHEAFIKWPVFCRLSDLFRLLDGMDLQERHQILGPVYQDVFKKAGMKLQQFRTEEEAFPEVYRLFKEKVTALSLQVGWCLLISGIVTTTLAWLLSASDEERIEEIINHNRSELRKIEEGHARGQVPQHLLEAKRGEVEELINKSPQRHGAQSR